MKKILVLLTLLGTAAVYADPPVANKGWWNSVTSFFKDDVTDKYTNWTFSKDRKSETVTEFRANNPTATDADVKVWGKIQLEKHKKGTEMYKTARALETIRGLTQPRTILGITVCAGIVMGLWHGSSLVKEVAQNYLSLPALAEKTSIRSWGSKVKDFFVYEDRTVAPRNEVILSELLLARTEILTQSIMNAAKYDTFFRHCLFYGPPGTGKTMLAMAMAQEAGLEYIYFSAAALEQYSLEQGVQQIRHLFEYAKAYPKKLMIIMDEGDAIFAHRDTCSDKVRTFLNLILTYMGTPQSDYVVISLSNRPKDFDTAAKSRFGAKVLIGPPAHAERMKLFDLYIRKYLIESYTINRDKRSVYQWLFSRRPKKRMQLNIADDVLTEGMFNELARRSEGLVGRDIADVILSVQNGAYGTDDQTITSEMLIAALEDKKQQLIEIERDFE